MEADARELKLVVENTECDHEGSMDSLEKWTMNPIMDNYVVARTILEFLDLNTLLTCRLVCRSWNTQITTMTSLWRYWCQKQPVQLDRFRSVSNTDYFHFFVAANRIVKRMGLPQTDSDHPLVIEQNPDSCRVDLVTRSKRPYQYMVVNYGEGQPQWIEALENYRPVLHFSDLVFAACTIHTSRTYLRVMSHDKKIDYKFKTSVHAIQSFKVHSSGRVVMLTCECDCDELYFFNDHLREVRVRVPSPDRENIDGTHASIGNVFFLSDIDGHLAVIVMRTYTVTVIEITDEGRVLRHKHLPFEKEIISCEAKTSTGGECGFVVVSKDCGSMAKVEKFVVDVDLTSGMKTRNEWEWSLDLSVLPTDYNMLGVGKHFMLISDCVDLLIYQRNDIVAIIRKFLKSQKKFYEEAFSRDPYFVDNCRYLFLDLKATEWLDGLSPDTTRPRDVLFDCDKRSELNRLSWAPGLWGHLDDDSRDASSVQPTDETTDQCHQQSLDRSTNESCGNSLDRPRDDLTLRSLLVQTPKKSPKEFPPEAQQKVLEKNSVKSQKLPQQGNQQSAQQAEEPQNDAQQELGVWTNPTLFSQRLREGTVPGAPGFLPDCILSFAWDKFK